MPSKSQAAANLGTKRVCPKCTSKFYDFGKATVECPKCGSEVDTTKPALAIAPKPAPRKPEPVEAESASSDDSGGIESLDDLEDDETIVADIGDDDDESNDY